MTKLSELKDIKNRRLLLEPKIEKLIHYRKERYYISRVVKYLPEGEGVYQYMWRDRSWNTTCGSANMWGSREECERFLYGYSGVDFLLRETDFTL